MAVRIDNRLNERAREKREQSAPNTHVSSHVSQSVAPAPVQPVQPSPAERREQGEPMELDKTSKETPPKKKKFTGACYVCDEIGHFAKECPNKSAPESKQVRVMVHEAHDQLAFEQCFEDDCDIHLRDKEIAG
ncbi:hypothetical protein SEPCBS119000_006805, partial [Sporothrix epigloea]